MDGKCVVHFSSTAKKRFELSLAAGSGAIGRCRRPRPDHPALGKESQSPSSTSAWSSPCTYHLCLSLLGFGVGKFLELWVLEINRDGTLDDGTDSTRLTRLLARLATHSTHGRASPFPSSQFTRNTYRIPILVHNAYM